MLFRPKYANTALLHWRGEEERLERDTGDVLRFKAKAWFPSEGLPKAPTLLRHKLKELVQRTISELEGMAMEPPAQVITPALPNTSTPTPEVQDHPTMALAADRPSGDSATGAVEGRHPCASEPAPAPADIVQRLNKENAWLRRTLTDALRAMQAAGVQLPLGAAPQQPTTAPQSAPVGHSPGENRQLAGAKEVVFFGLPLTAGASRTDASQAVQQFCAQKLLLPNIQCTEITHVGTCRSLTDGFAHLRPATVVVACMGAQEAAAIFKAKRSLLNSTCPVSIDWQRSPEERRCCQAQRLARRQVGEAGREGGAEADAAQQGARDREPEGDVAALQ